jgi:hypothetical protein
VTTKTVELGARTRARRFRDAVRAASGCPCRYLSGYGSSTPSPPVTVSHLPFPQDGHGGRCFVETTSSSLPHFVHRRREPTRSRCDGNYPFEGETSFRRVPVSPLDPDPCPPAPVRVKVPRVGVDERRTIPERVTSLEGQTYDLAEIVGNLIGIAGALTAIAADLRSKAYEGVYDASLPDIEKDLKTIGDQLDETWPRRI